MKRHDAPLTAYLIDLCDCQDGRLSADELRNRWKAGKYRGVKPEWASAYAKLHNVR